MKKSLVSAIKKLLAKLGAEEIEGNNLVEVIDSGAEAIEGGGGSGGGITPIVINVTTNGNTGTWNGATWEELLNAFNHGVAFAVLKSYNPNITIQLNVYTPDFMGETGTDYACLKAIYNFDTFVVDRRNNVRIISFE